MYASCWQYLIKEICLTILILPFFNSFLALSKMVKEMSSWDTYGSFRQDFLADKKGKLIKTDRVFFNICDYQGLIYAPRSIRVERWYHPKVALLKKHLRKKWKKESVCKSLPIINVVFKKIEVEELRYNPIPYIEDEEQYFSNLISWKNNFEEQLLNKHPYLKRSLIRHRKISRHVKVKTIR